MKWVTLLKSRLAHRGGAEKYTLRLARMFAARGCLVKILTSGPPPAVEGVEVISLGRSSKFSLYHLLKFDNSCKEWLKNNPSDVIFGMERTTYHTHYRAGSGVHAVYLKKRMEVEPLLKKISLRLNPLHRLLLQLEKKAFEHPDLRVLFTNSSQVKREIIQNYATDPSKIEVVHNGVEWKEFEAPFKAGFETPRPGPFHFLFVGNGYERKGLPFLLRGLARVKTPFQLTVVGKEKNEKKFRKMAHLLGLSDKICFAGAQKDLTLFYQRADVLAIPSIYDPFANVTVEALAMGLFVLSSPSNGGSEVLRPDTGRVIEHEKDFHYAFDYPKTLESAIRIRHSVKQLDFSNQLATLVDKTLCTS